MIRDTFIINRRVITGDHTNYNGIQLPVLECLCMSVKSIFASSLNSKIHPQLKTVTKKINIQKLAEGLGKFIIKNTA